LATKTNVKPNPHGSPDHPFWAMASEVAKHDVSQGSKTEQNYEESTDQRTLQQQTNFYFWHCFLTSIFCHLLSEVQAHGDSTW